eukprot:UN20744
MKILNFSNIFLGFQAYFMHKSFKNGCDFDFLKKISEMKPLIKNLKR